MALFVLCFYSKKDWRLSGLYYIFNLEFFKIFHLGIFSQQLGKRVLFGIGNGVLFRPQIRQKRNTGNEILETESFMIVSGLPSQSGAKIQGACLFGPRQANLLLITYASSEGSGEPAHPRSLARTSAARSYKQWVKRNLQTESQIHSPSEWLGMRN